MKIKNGFHFFKTVKVCIMLAGLQFFALGCTNAIPVFTPAGGYGESSESGTIPAPPRPTINTSEDGSSQIYLDRNSSTYTLSGTCLYKSPPLQILVDGKEQLTEDQMIECDPTSLYSVTIDVSSLSEGTHTLLVTQNNEDGTVSYVSETVYVIKDLTPPVAVLTLEKGLVEAQRMATTSVGNGVGGSGSSSPGGTQDPDFFYNVNLQKYVTLLSSVVVSGTGSSDGGGSGLKQIQFFAFENANCSSTAVFNQTVLWNATPVAYQNQMNDGNIPTTTNGTTGANGTSSTSGTIDTYNKLNINIPSRFSSYQIQLSDKSGNTALSACSAPVVKNQAPSVQTLTLYANKSVGITNKIITSAMSDPDQDALSVKDGSFSVVSAGTLLSGEWSGFNTLPVVTTSGSGDLVLNFNLVNLNYFSGKVVYNYTVVDAYGSEATGQLIVKVMTPFTWTGELVDHAVGAGKWSIKTNWCGSVNVDYTGCNENSILPSSSNTVIFDDTCDGDFCNSNLDSSFMSTTLGHIIINKTFNGTITVGATGGVLNLYGGFFQAGGRFLLGDLDLKILGASGFKLFGGDFNGQSGYIETSTSSDFLITGGTFTAPYNPPTLTYDMLIQKNWSVASSTESNPVVFNSGQSRIKFHCGDSLGCSISPGNHNYNYIRFYNSGTYSFKINGSFNILKEMLLWGNTTNAIILNNPNIPNNPTSEINLYGNLVLENSFGAKGTTKLNIVNTSATALQTISRIAGAVSVQDPYSMLSTTINTAGTLVLQGNFGPPPKYYFLKNDNPSNSETFNDVEYGNSLIYKSGTLVSDNSEVIFACNSSTYKPCRVQVEKDKKLAFNKVLFKSESSNTIEFMEVDSNSSGGLIPTREADVEIKEMLTFETGRYSNINNVKLTALRDVSVGTNSLIEGGHQVGGTVRLHITSSNPTTVHNINQLAATQGALSFNFQSTYPRTTINTEGTVIFYGLTVFKPKLPLNADIPALLESDKDKDGGSTLSGIYNLNYIAGAITFNSNYTGGDVFFNNSPYIQLDCEFSKTCYSSLQGSIYDNGFPLGILLDGRNTTSATFMLENFMIKNRIKVVGNSLGANYAPSLRGEINVSSGTVQVGDSDNNVIGMNYAFAEPLFFKFNNNIPGANITFDWKYDSTLPRDAQNLYTNIYIKNYKDNNNVMDANSPWSTFDFANIYFNLDDNSKSGTTQLTTDPQF